MTPRTGDNTHWYIWSPGAGSGTKELFTLKVPSTFFTGGTSDYALSNLLEVGILRGTPHPLYVEGFWVEYIQLAHNEFLFVIPQYSWFLKQAQVAVS